MSRKRIVSIATAGVFASAALMAAVTFNPETGEGFVGKGDVQSAFGWNNAQVQANIDDVTFHVQVSQSVEQDCYETGGQPTDETFTGVRTGTIAVSSATARNLRTHKQVDGIFLTGYENGPPVFGDEDEIEWNQEGPGSGCPLGPGQDHPNGQPRFGPVTVDALFATWNGITVQIWP